VRIKAVIPGQMRSRHSPSGDAEQWGGTSRLLWKLNQAADVVGASNVHVCATEEDAEALAIPHGIHLIKRDANLSMTGVIKRVACDFDQMEVILWLNSTFPFFGPRQIRSLCEQGLRAAEDGRGAVSGRSLRNLVVDGDGRSLNFVPGSQANRQNLRETFEIIPAASLARAGDMLHWQAQYRRESLIVDYSDVELSEIGTGILRDLRGHEAFFYLMSQES
jgi:hypothetical protein